MNLLRSLQETSYFQITWKLTVTYHNLARVLNQIAEKGGADACEAAPAAEEAAEAPAAE